MRKIWTIALRDIYTVFTDRNLILIMLVTPLVLSTIIALAFSNLSGGGAPLRDIPMAIVNLDEGMDDGLNSGALFVSLLVPGQAVGGDDQPACDQIADAGQASAFTLLDLTDARLMDDPEAARAAVDQGELTAVLIIPPDFSRRMAYTQATRTIDPVSLEVYASPARPVSAGVVRSIVESITNQILTGQITVSATIETLIQRAQDDPAFGLRFLALTTSGEFQPDFACAFVPALNPIAIDQQTIQGDDTPNVNLLVVFGSSLAVFFALFTANGGATNILEESRNGTLQRLLVSPTSRMQIMFGKLLGIFAMVLLQLIFLFIALTLVNTLLTGQFAMIWGDNLLLVAILLIVSALATAGVGMLTAAAATSPEQAGVIGGITAMFMGVVGGAFFQLPPGPIVSFVSSFSVVYWGSDAFTSLSRGQTDILLNLLVLGIIGAIFFAISLVVFNRRQDI